MNTPVSDHIKHSSKLGRLSERACSLTVDGIEETRDAVGKRAVLRMVAHETERHRREDDPRIS